MTESEWLESDCPSDMLRFLRDQACERKLRLFACEAFRVFIESKVRGFQWRELDHPEPETLRVAPLVAEQFADGHVGIAELQSARQAAAQTLEHRPLRWLEHAALMTCETDPWMAASRVDSSIRHETDLLLEWEKTSGKPSGPSLLPGEAGEIWRCDLLRDIFGNPFHPVTVDESWLGWNGGAVVHLARSIYDEGAFDRLPILADALTDAGCDNSAMLHHCREAANHVRGCWVVDLLLGMPRVPGRNMTEQEWLACGSSRSLLQFLRRASPRKLRLYACEAVRLVAELAPSYFADDDLVIPREDDDPLNAVVPTAVRLADGLVSEAEVTAVRDAVRQYYGGSFSGVFDYANWLTLLPDAWEAANRVDRALEYALEELRRRDDTLRPSDFVEADEILGAATCSATSSETRSVRSPSTLPAWRSMTARP